MKSSELLDLAETCGAIIAGKPDGGEPITIVFSINAWREFAKEIEASQQSLTCRRN